MSKDNQRRILEACSACIARQGVRGLRVQDVAKEAGVSSGLIYYHFTDRDGLLVAALEYVNTDSVARRKHPAVDREAAHAQLRTLLLDEIQDLDTVRSKSIVWNEIRAMSVFDPSLAEHLATSTVAWHHNVAALVHASNRAGASGADNAALLLTALVEGLSSRWLSGQLGVDEARAALERGLAAILPEPQ